MLTDLIPSVRPKAKRGSAWALARTTLVLLCVTATGCGALKRCAYEGFNRDEWQKPDEVIRALNVEPGDHVADLGAGSGYFTFRLDGAVGAAGKVYAIDVDPDMTTHLTERVEREGRANIEVILAGPHDPGLPGTAVDLIFTCNVYHHLEDRPAYFAGTLARLKPGGRVAIIDFSGDGWLERYTGHATPGEKIIKEMNEAGYALENTFDFLPKQVFLVFAPRATIQ